MVEDMARKQVLVQLDGAQIAVLDRLAEASDESRSGLIRQAIDLYVRAVDEALADVAYAEAYERQPEDLEEFADLRSAGLHAWPD
jgi:predicted transcriptional regulator